MSWLADPRPSFTHVSTHQTYVGKALYEHARSCATIAAVACISSSLLKSSLGPNLLALIEVNSATFDLFDKIFLEYNPPMQLTQKLVVDSYVDPDVATVLIEKLKSNGPLFPSSLQHAEINSESLSFFEEFRSLRSLSLSNMERCEQLTDLTSLSSLSELKLLDCVNFGAAFFEALGDLENNRNLTSLDISGLMRRSWSSEGFQKDFCGRLLSKNRLVKLELPIRAWNLINKADEEVFVKAGMTNLVELGDCVPAKLIRGEGFVNLRILSVTDASDEDLVNVGNQCLLLEVLDAGDHMTGSFLNDDNLVGEAFNHLRELSFASSNLSDSDVGPLFSRLLSIKKLKISVSSNFVGSCLQHLPNPDRLRTVIITFGTFSIRNLHRFVNLEVIELYQIHLSREDILSFARFKQLKRISLIRCGGEPSSSALFRTLCRHWPNLEKLSCYGKEESKWTEGDVEAILIECQHLRILRFGLDRDEKMSYLEKKYPWVRMTGELQKKNNEEKESGSRREREE